MTIRSLPRAELHVVSDQLPDGAIPRIVGVTESNRRPTDQKSQ